MPKAAWVQTNFNGGEWTPLAYGRFDLEKYRNGLALCENYMPMQQGGLTRRPGTRFVAAAKSSLHPIRLQRFEFSITQAYVLEFGDLYIRFYANDGQLQTGTVAAYNNATAYVVGDLASYGGTSYRCTADSTGNLPTDTDFWHPLEGTILEVATPYTWEEIWSLGFTQSADTLYIAHPNHPPMKLQRRTAVAWVLKEVDFIDGPYLPVNVTATTLTPSATSGTANVVASTTDGINGDQGFLSSDVGRMLRIKCGGVWLWGRITTVTDSTHVVWDIQPPNGDQIPTTAQAVANLSAGSVFSVSVTDGGGGYGTRPPSVSFSGGGGSGAVAYASLTNGVVTSVTVASTGTGYTTTPTVAFTAPTAIVASTTGFWALGVWNSVDGYPTCCTFHQDRLFWGGAPSTPSRVDASNTADYENYAPSNLDGTVVDSNALSFTLNSTTVNNIHWMRSDEWGLLVGTAGGEWAIAPSSTQQAITQTNVNIKLMSDYGSAETPPVRIGKTTLFIQRTGRKVRELLYQFMYSTFSIVDISLLGEHLTKSGIKQMALQLAPQQIAWLVRNDGELVAFTYDKDQDICGWHRHTLGGYSDAGHTVSARVDSAAGIPAPNIQRDEIWLATVRYINGATVRYIEVMSKMWEDGDEVATSNFLDCSRQSSGAPTTTITGYTWLAGETIGVLTDGAVHPDCVVAADGSFELQLEASVVQAGPRYTSRGKTLRIEAGGANGPAQGKRGRIMKLVFRFFQSIGLSLGSDDPNYDPYPESFRNIDDPMDAPVPLFDGDKEWPYEGTWTMEKQIHWSTSDPLPSNITMLAAQVDTQDSI